MAYFKVGILFLLLGENFNHGASRFSSNVKLIEFSEGRISVSIENAIWSPGEGPADYFRGSPEWDIFLHDLSSNVKASIYPGNPSSEFYIVQLDAVDKKRIGPGRWFLFTDKELADRVAKAFSHLIKLSGGKDEPF